MMKKAVMTIIAIIISLLVLGCAQQADTEKAGQPEEKATAPIPETAKPGATKSAQSDIQPTEVNKMASILMIIAPDGFRDEEYFEPKKIFEAAGAQVTTASKGVSEAKGKLGATAKVDVDIASIDATEYDAVVFVGGPGTTVYFDDPSAHKIAKDAYSAGKVTAAICIAPSILANAGVLEDHEATAFSSEKDNVDAKSKGYTGDDVTVDGKVVTGNGPGAATEFGQEIMKLLS
jgi:protease I